MTDKNDAPERIFKSRESCLVYSGVKNLRYDIEYIRKDIVDKEKAASYVEGYNKAEKDNE